MKIFNKNLNDILYFITPPILYRYFNNKLAKRSLINDRQVESLKSSLDSLRKQRINYFFEDSVIDDFCDAMEENFYTHTPQKTKNVENQSFLDQLENKGFVVLPGLLNNNEIKSWMSKLDPIINKHSDLLKKYRDEEDNDILTSKTVTHSEGGMKVIHNIFNGVIRMWNPSSLVPEIANRVEQNETVNDICQAYLSNKSSNSISYLDIKCIPDSIDASVIIHFDSPFKLLKVFIPLEDIEMQHAPFLYFSGTHKPQPYKLLKSFLEYTHLNKKYEDSFASFSHIGMFKIAEKFPEYNIKPQIVTLKAGDVIIADTNGMHAATNLLEGRRVQLGLVYGMRGYDIGEIPENIKRKVKDSVPV